MLRLAGRPKLAAEQARRALEIEPDMPMALSNLGVALYELKDYEEAARAQRQAIAAKPEFRRSAQQSRQRAACAASGSTRRSPPIAARIELKPNYADAWANLGTTLHHSGDFDEGIDRRCAAPSRSRPITPTPIPGSAFCC